jgi:hypothetical protein
LPHDGDQRFDQFAQPAAVDPLTAVPRSALPSCNRMTITSLMRRASISILPPGVIGIDLSSGGSFFAIFPVSSNRACNFSKAAPFALRGERRSPLFSASRQFSLTRA